MKLTEEQARRESKKDLESVGIYLSETPTSSTHKEDLASTDVHLPKVMWHSWEELMSDYDEEDKNLVEISKKLEKRENPFEDTK